MLVYIVVKMCNFILGDLIFFGGNIYIYMNYVE